MQTMNRDSGKMSFLLPRRLRNTCVDGQTGHFIIDPL